MKIRRDKIRKERKGEGGKGREYMVGGRGGKGREEIKGRKGGRERKERRDKE